MRNNFLITIILSGVIVLTIFILIPLATPQNQSGGVTTNLTIGAGGAPVLLQDIPNQTWAVNTNLTNSINLDEHFTDDFSLTYNNTAVQNITVIINQTLNSTNNTVHLVSFIPDYGFAGTRTVVFTASDGFLSTDSNLVYLNVVNDTEPPQWSSPSKNLAEIFQNNFVNFTASWTDNVELGGYIFSINQGGGWSNQTEQSFSGTQNTSRERVQISASGGTTVFWRFFARDTSGNWNVTDTQNFTVATQESTGSDDDDDSSSSSSSGGILGIFPTTETEQITDFIVEPAESFLIETKQGATSTITLKITNIGNQALSFTLDLLNLGQFTTLISEPTFTLEPGEAKNIVIEITAGRFLTPDIYFGEINIKTPARTQAIPVVVKVQPFVSNIGVTVNVSEEFRRIKPGEAVVANITLVNLADIEERQVTLYYAISDFFGNIVDAAQEEITMNRRTFPLERNLTTTRETEKGEYLFFARAINDGNISIGSDTFEVGARFNLAGFIRTNIIIILIIIFAIAMILFIVRHKHNKEKLRLLNLYLMVNELKALIKDNKTEEAVALYVRIKRTYGQPLSEAALLNKEKLKEEMQKLAGKLDLIAEAAQQQAAEKESEKKENDGDKKEEKGEDKDKEGGEEEKKNEGATKEKEPEPPAKEEKPADTATDSAKKSEPASDNKKEKPEESAKPTEKKGESKPPEKKEEPAPEPKKPESAKSAEEKPAPKAPETKDTKPKESVAPVTPAPKEPAPAKPTRPKEPEKKELVKPSTKPASTPEPNSAAKTPEKKEEPKK